MSYRVTVAPASEPLTLTQAKNYLKVDSTADDALITSFITAARMYIEELCEIKLIDTTILEKQNKFPYASEPIYLQVGNVTSISSVKYYDSAGSLQTLDASKYILDNSAMRAKIGLVQDETYPETRTAINTIEITYVSGFGADESATPDPIKVAMYMLIADYYENRYNRDYKSNNTAVNMILMRYKAYIHQMV